MNSDKKFNLGEMHLGKTAKKENPWLLNSGVRLSLVSQT